MSRTEAMARPAMDSLTPCMSEASWDPVKSHWPTGARAGLDVRIFEEA